MANIKIDKALIESIAKKNNEEFFEKVNEKISVILASAIERLGKQIPYISLENVTLQPFNEILSGAVTDNSTFHYLLGVENGQLELNTFKTNMFWRNFKKRLKYAWDNRRKHKQKKKKKNDEKALEIDFDASKYNIFNLTDDLFENIRQYLSPTSIISQNDNVLYIVGKDDFGGNSKIRIDICFCDADNFKLFTGSKKDLPKYNFTCRVNCLRQKIREAGPNFVKMLKIFNVLYFYANYEQPNAMFLESVLYNIPDKLYEENNIYSVFLKIVNYLTLKPINNFNSINDLGLKIYEDKMLGSDQQVGFLKMLRMISNQK